MLGTKVHRDDEKILYTTPCRRKKKRSYALWEPYTRMGKTKIPQQITKAKEKTRARN